MKTIFKSRSRGVAAAVGLSLIAGLACAQTPVANPNDEVNEHFAIASKLFGKDQVQLHAFQDGADGSRHKVYNFDCSEQTYNEVFDDDFEPEAFPIEAQTSSMQAFQPFDRISQVAPLAAHACKQHGVPLVGMEW